MNKLDRELTKYSNKGNINKVKELVERGANVNAQNDYGYSPMFYASRQNKLNIVKYLVENGAIVDIENRFGETPLMVASVNGNLEVVKYLIQSGANINKIGAGTTSLGYASRYGHLDVVKYLVENGADINLIGMTTPLMWANHNDHLDVVKYLVEAGADYRPIKDDPNIKSIIKDEINNLKNELTNNYLSLSKTAPKIKVDGKVISALPKSLLLKSVYEVLYQQLCFNIDRDYPPLKLISLANILKVDYDIDIRWKDLCGKINKVLYLML